MTGLVSITMQNTDEGRAIVSAILADNTDAVANPYPAMTKIDCEGRIVIRRETIEETLGREFDLGELTLSLVSISGNVDEDDDEFVLSWNA